MGFLVLFMLIIINLLLRTRLPPRTSGPLVEWSAFTEPAFLLFTFGVFLLYWALYFAFFYVRLQPQSYCYSDSCLPFLQIQVYASQKLGFDNISGVNLIIIINAAGMPARAPCGYLADRYLGPLNVLIPWVALCGIVVFCWAAVEDAADLYVFAVIYGVASAAAMGLFAGTVPSLTKDISKIGTRMGMVLTLISLGPLTGPSVAGALVAKTGGNYLAAQIWAGTSLLLAAVLLVAARLYTTGWHLKVKV